MRPMGLARAALTALTDLWWPPVCTACSRPLPLAEAGWRGHFCPDCLETVELLPAAVCPVCGRPFYHSSGHLCGECLAEPPPFKTARAAVAYRGAAARSIGRLKYYGDLTQIRALAALAAAIPLPETAAWELIVPLPLPPRRLAARGFNQALALARAAFRGRPLEPRLLTRPADPVLPQAALSRRQRQQAVRGSFQVPAPGLVRGVGLLLFDDVVTTGATAAEAARTLLAAGAREIHLAAVARTVRDDWR